ncbi:MAG: biotin synthase BioB [Chlorobium sp.]|jgi:biotin synthase|uniref:biotin synthase BioB n=1 Tax=Chlorobium sp. TaxID=1095 RepID=UPI001DDD8351|nr:biotin synthase BioB [Chlorobium sp.]MBN1278516.1 biotin synthase BioB [Chlorobiaceae bacterium]MCF8215578.1 biotin synthase BioB [Chlorobium sp.]MCF8270368.1 biotin synthase BioB [Chlorobium sp.]MCF8286737.1 biotin synthase BioB [Chlorobium sp.]MCF8290259.1 biotin synthase BioB [Chlorobium sp.]
MKFSIHQDISNAYCVLETGEPLDRKGASLLADIPGDAVLDLASLAHKVRLRYAGEPEGFHTCSIMNAKSGECGENCRFCAQSRHNSAAIDVYDLASEDEVLAQAAEARAQGVRHFGIVTSGYGYLKMTPEFRRILAMIDRLHHELPGLNVCASVGVLSKETAAALAAHGIAHYNINIQVAPSRYGDLIADTHTVDERIATVRLLREHAIPVCCGGILGVGESMLERIDMIFALAELDVSVIPLNVLVPIEGTPLAANRTAGLADIVKTFAICRLVHPRKIIKFAAGRETVMKDFQGLLMLSGANGFLTGGYLTTRGRDVSDDMKFMGQLEHFSGELP